MRRFLFLAAVAALLPAAAWPQAARNAPCSRIIVRSNLVIVPVTVKDNRGNLVPGLQRDDFRIFQDGVEQTISRFSAEPFPISAVVVLDDDLPNKLSEQVQRSLKSISAGFGPNDEVALVRFDEYPKTVLEFTNNNDLLFAKLKRLELDSRIPGYGSEPMTAGPTVNGQPITPQIPVLGTDAGASTKHLNDAIHYAGDMLRNRGRDRRKIIFVISDGANERHNQWSFKNTLQLLLSSDISLYAVAVGTLLFRTDASRLGKYASATGGDIFYASKQKELEQLYSLLTEEARNQYTLAYVPQRTDRRGNYHSIEVRVEQPGLAVIARQGYYSGLPR